MIRIAPHLLDEIEQAARKAYPQEACGLLVGRDETVTRVAVSPNVSENDKADSFEVDPALRFRLMRDLDGTNESIIGHFHSHPDHPALPSDRDLAQAYEPKMIWFITGLTKANVTETRAHRIDPETGLFREIKIVTS